MGPSLAEALEHAGEGQGLRVSLSLTRREFPLYTIANGKLPCWCNVNRHRAQGSDTWGSCVLPPCKGPLHKLGSIGRGPACLGTRALTCCPWKAAPPFMHPSPSPSLLQIKSQDLFQSWVAQLRAHRLAQRLDMPRGSLPSTTHRKVRWALGCRRCGDSGLVASDNRETQGGGHCAP